MRRVIEYSYVYSSFVRTVEMDEFIGIMRHFSTKGFQAVVIFYFVKADDLWMIGISYYPRDLFCFVVKASVCPTSATGRCVFKVWIKAICFRKEEVLHIIGHNRYLRVCCAGEKQSYNGKKLSHQESISTAFCSAWMKVSMSLFSVYKPKEMRIVPGTCK